METEHVSEKKRHGVFYTPNDLAKKLSESLIDGRTIDVFDPAYGNGALLLAAEDNFKLKSLPHAKINLYGCDIKPVNGLLKHLPEANLVESSFFDYSNEKKYDLILTNPPFVRHQYIDKNQIKVYRNLFDKLTVLGNASDLWAYFIIQTTYHLKEGGAVGAILPWSFIQADYALDLRLWLLDNFGEIELLGLNKEYFESAQERVVMLWLKNYGTKNISIKTAVSNSINDHIEMAELTKLDWGARRLHRSSDNINFVLGQIKEKHGFSEFGNYADAKLGIVTGADKFFIRPKEELIEYGLREDQLTPIMTGVRDIIDLLENGVDNLKRLACVEEKDSSRLHSLIKEGVDNQFNLRSHSKNRKPWFAIKQGRVPDAFIPYRVGEIPFLILNKNKLQSTNSIHRIYFKKLNVVQQKWIAVSLISVYGQLSLKNYAKSYGRGMIKIEPGTLKNILVVVKSDKQVNTIYNKILKLIKNGEKRSAIIIATEFISTQLGMSQNLILIAKSEWIKTIS